MSGFFIHVESGRVATHTQLVAAGEASESEPAGLPWHPVQGPRDASTLWYAVLRKHIRGRTGEAWIGTLCIRHGERQAYLESHGWEEVPVEAIRAGTHPGSG